MPGTLTIPKGEGLFYAVVLVAGSGPEDMNETMGPNEPFKDLAWGLLRETERIDPDEIFVLGHSLGGYFAPWIAARDENISGLILLAAGARSLPDEILQQTEYFASLDGKMSSGKEKIEESYTLYTTIKTTKWE